MIADEIKSGISPLAPYLRRLSTGLVVVLMSALAWFIGLAGLVITFFFYLSDLNRYILPALYTSLVCWGIGLILVYLGFRLLKKPR